MCSHPRLKGRTGQYKTNPNYMPILLNSYKLEQQAYNEYRYILKLAALNTPAKLEKVCAKALSLIHSSRYRQLRLVELLHNNIGFTL